MADLLFSFQEILDEIQAMSRIAAEFLTAETQEVVVRNLTTSLENIRADRQSDRQRWTVTSERPLRTIDSPGEYEAGRRRGEHTVFGEVTFVWEISCPRELRSKKSRAQNCFTLSGLSSTKVRILERQDGQAHELASWRFEVGDDTSPGCHFHTQIEGDREDPPYPKSLSVPRLPTILITPMAALEFVLAEMFQARWRQHAAVETAEMQRWRPIQKHRLKRLFEWQIDGVEHCMGSPWTALKGRKPAADLFSREK